MEKFRVLPNVIEGLQALKEQGFSLVMVSNQDGLGAESFPREDFEPPQGGLLSELLEEGIVFDQIFICPHTQSNNCECRKPKIGLVKQFLDENDIDLGQSLTIGDRKTDREFAENIGVCFVKMQTNTQFPRFASVKRETKETKIESFVNLDGSGKSDVSTGIGFLDHMIELFTKHSLIDLTLKADGDLQVDELHTVEDIGIVKDKTYHYDIEGTPFLHFNFSVFDYEILNGNGFMPVYEDNAWVYSVFFNENPTDLIAIYNSLML